MFQRQRGVTLIELVITVSIISILAAVAVPSYRNHMLRSHRSDATAALMKLAADQEKYYFQNSTYATLAQLGDPTTEHEWYTLAVTAADAATFTATATPKAAGPQADDSDCAVFRINAAGLRSAADSGGALNDRCWR